MTECNIRPTIDLKSYNYRRDIENRLFMSKLNAMEVAILQEIINGSLNFTLSHLVEVFEADRYTIISILDKLSATKLLHRTGELVVVNKELRKQFEAHIIRFDPSFQPGLEFFQSLLNKVPIHVLPNWYSISKTSNYIFQSIIEKYLESPKVFESYLKELSSAEPELFSLVQDVFNAPDFKIPSQRLKEKYNLPDEHFEKIMLVLEFGMICCSGYEKKGEVWEEVITPFCEWGDYLRFIKETTPPTLTNQQSILRQHVRDFGFIADMVSIIQALPESFVPIEVKKNSGPTLALKTVKGIIPHFATSPLSEHYIVQLIDRLLQLNLAHIVENRLCASTAAASWLKLTIQEQSHSLYRLSPSADSVISNFSEKDIREVEKNLKRVAESGWVSFHSFFAGMTIGIGNAEAVSLKGKGKQWKYQLPAYSDKERQFVEAVLCERLLETGIIAVGFQEELLCFYVTPFGRIFLSV